MMAVMPVVAMMPVMLSRQRPVGRGVMRRDRSFTGGDGDRFRVGGGESSKADCGDEGADEFVHR